MKRIVVVFMIACCSLQAQNVDLDQAKALINSDPEKAKVLVDPYLEGNDYLAAKSMAIYAKAEEKLDNYLLAFKKYNEALELLLVIDTVDHYLEYAIYNNLAMIAANSNQYEIAAGHYHDAAEAAARYVKYEPVVAEKYNEVFLANKMKFYEGNALYDAGLIDQALKVYLSIDELMKGDEIEDVNTFALLRNEYGLNAKAVKDWEQAKYYFENVINLAGVSGFYKTNAYHNLALVYKEQALYEEALEKFEQALKVKGAVDSQRFITLMDAGEMLMDIGQPELAMKKFLQAVALKVEVKNDLRLMKIYYLMERASKADIEKSNEYGDIYQAFIEEHIARQGELIALEKKRVFTMSLIQAEYDKKLKEVEQAYQIDKALRWIRVILIVLSCILIITYYLRKRALNALQGNRL